MKFPKRLVIYIDLILLLAFAVFLYQFTFQIPLEAFPSPLHAYYYKMFSSILIGLSISVSVLLVTEILFKPTLFERRLPKLLRRLLTKPRVRPVAVRARRAKAGLADLPVTFVSKYPMLRRTAEKFSLDIAEDVLQTGMALSPYRFMAKHLFYALASLFIAVPLGVYLTLTVHPLFYVVMLVPAVFLVYPKLRLRSLVGDRKRALEDEVPFFTIYANILQSVGLSLYNSLCSVIGKGVFRQIERDALMVKRNVEFFFKSPVEALEDLGRIHPNEKMKTLLLGYTSEWRSGGDMARYLEAKARDYLADMKFRWRRYAERAGDIGEAVTSLLFVFPMIVLMSAFVSPAQATTLMSVILSVGLPFLTVTVFGVIHAMQPKTYDVLEGNLAFSLVAGAVTIFTSLLLRTPLWLSISAALAAGSAFYGGTVLLQMREIRMYEDALPRFLRDVTEYKKMGYDVNRAIVRLSEEVNYNPVFDNLLKLVAKQIDLGVRMVEVHVPSRSWLTRMSFFLLGEVVESGGGTAACLEALTDFVNSVIRVKRETKASMRLYQLLSLFTPVGLSFVVGLMFTMLTAFTATIMPGVEAGLLGGIAEIPAELMETCYLMVVIASLCISLLSTKTVDLTAKNTMWLTVNMALAAIGISVSTMLADMLMGMVLPT